MEVHDLEGLNRLLESGLLEEQNRIIAGRGLSIGASMLAEREHLLPLAAEGFDLAALHFPQVNQSGCVKAVSYTHLDVYKRQIPASGRLAPRPAEAEILR